VKLLEIDKDYLLRTLLGLLDVPSPSGYTDGAVRFVCAELESLGIPMELTRRGAIRANLDGSRSSPDRALVAHVDTLGAMVRELKDNGRLALAPVGTWSSRFAEGARVTVLTENGPKRATILPLKASGHVYGDEVDTQPVSWANVEARVDVPASSQTHLIVHGFQVGNYVAIDPDPEVTDSGFIVSRHLDDKAGVACLLTAAKAVLQAKAVLPVDCHLLFTIFEEVGSGASAVLHQDVAEMVSVDNGTAAPGQNSEEHEVVVAFMDASGPFDYHLCKRLLEVGLMFDIPVRPEVFRYYRSDVATAVEAGNDIRTGLLGFGLDASHGYERTHIDGLIRLTKLITLYMQSDPVCDRDQHELGSLNGFPDDQSA
jgi:peptidase M42 family hydrolase